MNHTKKHDMKNFRDEQKTSKNDNQSKLTYIFEPCFYVNLNSLGNICIFKKFLNFKTRSSIRYFIIINNTLIIYFHASTSIFYQIHTSRSISPSTLIDYIHNSTLKCCERSLKHTKYYYLYQAS